MAASPFYLSVCDLAD